ncbi:protein of unknown function [Pricia antarctica]|uniref:DUF4357 domain-containing protein n=1 Tax=Pricia antarctica TaxID=641691 RepID=A0A1G7DPX6_9FLAO|nr:GIY-YIG nuclease family protein [Pricia antarctica]SDE53547.1 protein of unknown function [Pricia antarctica]
MPRPQTIQIFLPDGTPTSIREAELTNRLVKAVLFPRNKLQEVAKRELVHFTGVYFLFGAKEDAAKPVVYIGEGEDCYKRILNHNRIKDFWTYCIVITTKTNEYTKTDVKFLEHYSIQIATQIDRYHLDNDTGSRKTSLPESREYDLLDNFDTAKILLATLGYPIFEEKRKPQQTKEIFFCQRGTIKAIGELVDEGFLVYKGSQSEIINRKGISTWILNLREKLIAESVLQEQDGVLIFTSDYIFNSPSAAAATVLASAANGWKRWKDNQGKTLDELKRA